MTSTDIANYRLINQQIAETKFTEPTEIVSWLGAMQAQDFPMSKWAIGVRLPNINEAKIEQAIANGDIIRTHVLRPTWHLVSANDARWMLALTAPHVKISMHSNNKLLELTDNLFQKSNEIIQKTLEGGKQLTREEIMLALKKSGIETNSLRAAHFMMHAELDGIVCNGSFRGKKLTYALLEEKLPKSKFLERQEALAELAKRYFTSHSPATLQDFVWWSGLSVADARLGLEMNKINLISEKIGELTYWLSSSYTPKPLDKSIYFLPSFDEFMVSYKNRSASLDTTFNQNVITANGIFKPIIVVDGKAIGIWNRSFKKDKIAIETIFFDSENRLKNEEIEQHLGGFGKFLNQKIEILT